MANGKLVLDIGAADNPFPEATHAIDMIEPDITPDFLHKKYPNIQQYKIGNVNKPPKEWKGKFDKVVSRGAMGGSALTGIATSRAIDFLTKTDATARIHTTISWIPSVDRMLSNAGFTITRILTTEQTTWIPALGEISADTIIYAQKNLKPNQTKVLESFRGEVMKMPIPIQRIKKDIEPRRRIKPRTAPQGLKGIRR